MKLVLKTIEHSQGVMNVATLAICYYSNKLSGDDNNTLLRKVKRTARILLKETKDKKDRHALSVILQNSKIEHFENFLNHLYA